MPCTVTVTNQRHKSDHYNGLLVSSMDASNDTDNDITVQQTVAKEHTI